MGEEPAYKGHRARLKSRFLAGGLDVFEDYEVLELLLFYSVPQRDTKGMARALLKRFGSLSAVLDGSPDELAKVDGIGEHSAVLLSLLPEVSRRYMRDRLGGKPCLDSTDKAGEFALSRLAGLPLERFCMLCLDARSNLLHEEVLREGTADEAAAYPREIAQLALRHNASGIILMHNHPGGSRKLSEADVAVTKTVISALEPLGVAVLDHIVVAGDGYCSLRNGSLKSDASGGRPYL